MPRAATALTSSYELLFTRSQVNSLTSLIATMIGCSWACTVRSGRAFDSSGFKPAEFKLYRRIDFGRHCTVISRWFQEVNLGSNEEAIERHTCRMLELFMYQVSEFLGRHLRHSADDREPDRVGLAQRVYNASHVLIPYLVTRHLPTETQQLQSTATTRIPSLLLTFSRVRSSTTPAQLPCQTTTNYIGSAGHSRTYSTLNSLRIRKWWPTFHDQGRTLSLQDHQSGGGTWRLN